MISYNNLQQSTPCNVQIDAGVSYSSVASLVCMIKDTPVLHVTKIPLPKARYDRSLLVSCCVCTPMCNGDTNENTAMRQICS